jgi:hypothetical protein
MIERRTTQRIRTFKGGAILFGNAPAVECIVRNLSDKGALLTLDSTYAIPDSFTVLMRPEIRKRNCQVVWRVQDRLGVQFV